MDGEIDLIFCPTVSVMDFVLSRIVLTSLVSGLFAPIFFIRLQGRNKKGFLLLSLFQQRQLSCRLDKLWKKIRQPNLKVRASKKYVKLPTYIFRQTTCLPSNLKTIITVLFFARELTNTLDNAIIFLFQRLIKVSKSLQQMTCYTMILQD
jgi:hypothetical protein